MPVYQCCRGSCEASVIAEGGGFVVRDILGHDWICKETTEAALGEHSLADAMADAWFSQALLIKAGFKPEGGLDGKILRANLDDLPKALGEPRPERPEPSPRATVPENELFQAIRIRATVEKVFYDQDDAAIMFRFGVGTAAGLSCSHAQAKAVQALLPLCSHAEYDPALETLLFALQPKRP